MSLQRIGVKLIANLTEDSAQAIAANAVWEYVRDEVLEAKDWKFAKVRVALEQLVTAPEYGYDYAYALPYDFLRICLTHEDDNSFYPSGAYASAYTADEVTVRSRNYGYSIETIADGTMCLFSDYDNEDDELYINYIRRVTDPAKYSPSFISALAFRMAAEVSITRTEGRQKFIDMMTLYDSALKRADEINSQRDYIRYEYGSEEWERAGR